MNSILQQRFECRSLWQELGSMMIHDVILANNKTSIKVYMEEVNFFRNQIQKY